MAKRSGTAQRAFEIAEPVISAMGLDLVDCEYKKENSAIFLRVFIDKRGGVSIDECESASKALDPVFDEKLNSNHDYFEVSSPGLNRPLQTFSDFNRHAGKKVDISLYQQVDGKKKYTGTILSAEQDAYKLLCDNGIELVFTYEQTASCKQIIEF